MRITDTHPYPERDSKPRSSSSRNGRP